MLKSTLALQISIFQHAEVHYRSKLQHNLKVLQKKEAECHMYYNNHFHSPRQEDLNKSALWMVQKSLCAKECCKRSMSWRTVVDLKNYTPAATSTSRCLCCAPISQQWQGWVTINLQHMTIRIQSWDDRSWKNWLVWYYGAYVKLNQVLWFTLHTALQDAEEVSWVHWNLFVLPPLTSDLWNNIFLILYPSD